MLKTNLRKFRKLWLKLLILDSLMLSLVLFFMVFARNRITQYLLAIQSYSPQIETIQKALESPDPSTVLQLEALMDVVDPLVNKALFFLYLVVPVSIFLIYCFFQSSAWNLVRSRKFFDVHDFLIFLLISSPFFIAASYLVLNSVSLLYTFSSLIPSILLGVLSFFLFYFTLVAYCIDRVGNIKKYLKFSLKKFYVLFPLYLLFFLMLLALLTLFFNLFILALAKVFSLTSVVFTLIILLLLVLFSFYRIFLYEYLKK